ncbi:unnamed protein product [Urochloa humidicola]
MNVITSPTFVTNARSYGPFGKGHGTPFHTQMQNNGMIVGFFGRSSQYLNAIGVYTNQEAGVARIGPSSGNGVVLRDITEHDAGPSGDYHNKLEIAKFGPWGGDGGSQRDIKVLPYRLDRVTIRSGTIIDAIEFSYTDKDGQYHTAGPWGGQGGGNNSFQLGPSEFLKGVSGSIRQLENKMTVITSLTFVTNARSYGPFGKGRGTPFHTQMQNNRMIVGFFGRSSQYLNALGVYTNQEAGVARIGRSSGDGVVLRDITEHDAGPSGDYRNKLEIAKFGPWGGDGGSQRDIKVLPYRLDRVTIRSGTIIDAIEFSYTDKDGQYHTAGPWGGQGGGNNSFQLGPSEFLTGVSGSIGQLKNKMTTITSLTFVTNARSYGPFGKGRATSFHIPMQSNGSIVGFFGRSGRYVDSIGVYTNHKLEIIGQKEAGIARIGPWGGDGKVLHDIKEKPHHLQRVTIFSGTIINSLEYLYSDHNGQQHTAGPWGGCGGTGRKIHLEPEEFIVKVSGTFHPCPWDRSIPSVVSSLTLATNTGKSHGHFGTELGAAFNVPVQSNSRIVGFFAHGENYIEAIGAYVRTL